jgi:hypothetical protein
MARSISVFCIFDVVTTTKVEEMLRGLTRARTPVGSDSDGE